jgi:hypothetical protein
VLPNDAVVYVQKASSPLVSIQIFVANANAPDTAATYGYRHLLEHIIARSVPGHDIVVETAGGSLDAATTRDTIRFEWNVPPSLVPTVASTMRKFLEWKNTTPAEIQREAEIIRHEVALQDGNARSAKEAWDAVFEDQAISMLGDAESCLKATPSQLVTLWKKLTVGSQIVVSVIGPVDLSGTAKLIRTEIEGLPKGGPKQWLSRSINGSYGTKPEYPDLLIPIDDIATDRVRLDALTPLHRKHYGDSWFAEDQETVVDVDGYVAPPLDGLWASAPYLHNGSVPTLWHLLHPDERPGIWKRSQLSLDTEKMGLQVETVSELPRRLKPAERRWYFDTSLPGKSAAGHDYPSKLTEPEKVDLLEYLKTL